MPQAKKHIANFITENLAQVSSTKNYSNHLNSHRIKEEKNIKKFIFDNSEIDVPQGSILFVILFINKIHFCQY